MDRLLSDDGQGVIHTLASSLPDEILSIPSFPLRLQTFPNDLSWFTFHFRFQLYPWHIIWHVVVIVKNINARQG